MNAAPPPPSTPRRVVIRRPGGHHRLRLEPMAVPTPAAGQVRVAVEAIGVNFADCLVRMGVYAPAKRYVGWPITPGFEVAGRIEAVGAGLDATALAGRRVTALTRFGAYASHVVVDAAYLVNLPDAWSMAEGAAFAVNALTARHALDLAGAAPRCSVLVLSAAGGVGQWLVQLARLEGLDVTGVVGAADKIDAVRAMGARAVVRGSAEAAALPAHFVAVFDAQGPESWRGSYDLLAPTGRLVVYGAHGLTEHGRIPWLRTGLELLRRPRFDALRLCADNKGILGFNLAYLFDRAGDFGQQLDRLVDQVVSGKLRFPPITTFPLAAVGDAQRSLESGRTIGKIVLEVAP